MQTIMRWTWALALVACDPGVATQDEPCAVDDDCGGKQSCLRTAAERELGLPGICSASNDPCLHGQQLGCTCTPQTYEMDCVVPALTLYEGYPEMACDEAALVCVVLPSDGGETEGG